MPPERIRVVGNGVDDVFTRRMGSARMVTYVLALGTLEPRKNLARVVEAPHVSRASSCASSARLGGEASTCPAGWASSRTRSSHGCSPEVPRCLVYASLYEGFGLPVLEAMACGTPARDLAREARSRRSRAGQRSSSPIRSIRESIAAGIAEADGAPRRARPARSRARA